MAQKKILFITNQLPFPPNTGGKVKSWNLIKRLSEFYKIGLITLLKNGEESHEVEMKKKLNFHHYYSEFLDVPRTSINFLKSFLGHDTLNVFRNYSSSFYNHVNIEAPNYDLVIVDHYDVYPAVGGKKGILKILHQHNAEYCLWERMSSIEKNPLKKLAISLEAKRIKKAEKKYSIDSDLTWAAPNDIEALSGLGIAREKFEITYHLGEDHLLSDPDIQFSDTEKQIIFVGTQSWEANINGMEWFLKNVWPIVRKKDAEIKLVIIGKDPSKRLKDLAQDDAQITFTGYVKKLEDYYKNARVSIVPLLFGSGMKVKLLNAMFRGIPSVATEVGAEGIEVKNGEHMFISNEVKSFAENILELIENENKWVQFRDKSRQVSRDLYSWNSLIKKHRQEIDKLIG